MLTRLNMIENTSNCDNNSISIGNNYSSDYSLNKNSSSKYNNNISPNKNIQKNNIVSETNNIFQKSDNNKNFELNEKEKLKITFMNDLIKGYNFLSNKDYEKSLPFFKNCITISSQLEDYFNLSDSLCNYSICLFYQGNLEESLKFAESSYKNLNKILIIDKKLTELKIKVLCNLILSYFSFNKCENGLNTFNELIEIIDEVASEKDRQFHIKIVIYTFFRVKSLVNYESDNYFLNEKYNDSNSIMHLNLNIFNIFHKYMLNNNIEYWIESLNQEIDKLKGKNSKIDVQTLIFLTFQYEIGKSNLENNSDDNNKKKIIGLCNYIKNQMNMSNDVSIKKPEIIIKEQNEKLESSKKIYNILYSKEEELLNKEIQSFKNENDDKDLSNSRLSISSNATYLDFGNQSCSKEFIQLLLKYSLKLVKNDKRYKNDYGTKLLKQLNLTNELINKNMLDLNGIKISYFDHNISKSLIKLFENLIFIYPRHMLLNGYNKFKKKISIKNLVVRDKKINDFLLNNFDVLQEGEILTKINYNSLGIKEHFYKVFNNEDNDSYEIRIFPSILDTKPKKKIPLNSIIKITYGIYSENIKRKFLNLNQKRINAPWLFLSIFYKNKTIDLYLEHSKLIKWFYGFYSYFKMYQCPNKIVSVRYFLLNRIKLKAIHNLKELSNESENLSEKDEDIINNLSNDQGIQQFSFCKIILLYNKILPL